MLNACVRFLFTSCDVLKTNQRGKGEFSLLRLNNSRKNENVKASE